MNTAINGILALDTLKPNRQLEVVSILSCMITYSRVLT